MVGQIILVNIRPRVCCITYQFLERSCPSGTKFLLLEYEWDEDDSNVCVAWRVREIVIRTSTTMKLVRTPSLVITMIVVRSSQHFICGKGVLGWNHKTPYTNLNSRKASGHLWPWYGCNILFWSAMGESMSRGAKCFLERYKEPTIFPASLAINLSST